jgi:hypothetical protein
MILIDIFFTVKTIASVTVVTVSRRARNLTAMVPRTEPSALTVLQLVLTVNANATDFRTFAI